MIYLGSNPDPYSERTGVPASLDPTTPNPKPRAPYFVARMSEIDVLTRAPMESLTFLEQPVAK